MKLCNSSLHVQLFELRYADLVDQLGVTNLAYTLGSADLVYNLENRFVYVLFCLQHQSYNDGLQPEFCKLRLHIFDLQTLLGHFVWGELAM